MPHVSRPGARLSLEQARKQAKDILAGFRRSDRKTLDIIRWQHPRFHKLEDATISAKPFKLADAQLVVARGHHLENWTALKQLVTALERSDPAVVHFESAADLVISGDEAALRARLRADPALVHARSARAHHSTLLHYVSANGVEDYRQVTPPSIVRIAARLLDAGADVNAESNAYGGGTTTLGLTATSAHPRLAGVQIELLDLLIARGATIPAIRVGGPWPNYALANGCPEAGTYLVQRFATPDTLYGAAGLGDLAAVERNFGASTEAEQCAALVLAVQCEHGAIAEWLLARGVPQRIHDGMWPLHWASGNGSLPLVEALVRTGGNLEAKNSYGGVVLANTTWFAWNALPHDLKRRNFPAMFDRLIALGADVNAYPDLASEIASCRERLAKYGVGSGTNDTIAAAKGTPGTVATKRVRVAGATRGRVAHINASALLRPSRTRLIADTRALDLAAVRAALGVRPDLRTVTDPGGRTLLHLASAACPERIHQPRSAQLAMVRWLLGQGFAVDETYGKDKSTALFEAVARARHPALVKLLIKHGARVTNAPGGGLFAAAWFDDASMARLLAANGADLEGVAEVTPLMAAWGWKKFKAARALVALGANVNRQDQKGRTLLHIGVEKQFPPAELAWMARHGANWDLRDRTGTSARERATASLSRRAARSARASTSAPRRTTRSSAS